MLLRYYPDGNVNSYFVITRDIAEKYYLYSVNKDKLTKLKTSDNPFKFKEVYKENES